MTRFDIIGNAMKITIFVWGMVLALLFCGCGSKPLEETESTVYIEQDGSITGLVVEPFSEGDYSGEELRDGIGEMIKIYNRDHESGAVKLISLELREGMAYARLHYQSAEDYAAFNGTDFYFGSVSDALSAGYAKKTTLKNAFGSNTVSGDAIADLGSYHMIAVSEHVVIRTYESVLYISANLETVDDKTVRVSDESVGTAYIIIK